MTKQTKLDPACGSLLQGRDSQEAGEVTVRSPCVPLGGVTWELGLTARGLELSTVPGVSYTRISLPLQTGRQAPPASGKPQK